MNAGVQPPSPSYSVQDPLPIQRMSSYCGMEYCHPHLGDIFKAQLKLSGKVLTNKELCLLGPVKLTRKMSHVIKMPLPVMESLQSPCLTVLSGNWWSSS